MKFVKGSWIILLTLFIINGATVKSFQNTSSNLIPCEDGWFFFRNKCYKVFEKQKGLAWQEAKDKCAAYDGNLVTIDSQELQDFLTTFLQYGTKLNLWIGLIDRQRNFIEFHWDDGSNLNYRNWDIDEPSQNIFRTERCVEMKYKSHGKIGMWNDQRCSFLQPFICQKNKNDQTMNHDPRFCSGENDGAWKYKNSCYHPVSEEMAWDDAENYCQDVLKGHLLTILDVETNLFVNDVLSSFSREYWIGIKMNDSMKRWSSGLIVKFEKFENGYDIYGNCAYVTEKRLWSSLPCFQKRPFVCEVPHNKSLALKQVPKDWRCPDLSRDWIDVGGENCYIFENISKAWDEANFICLKKGGHLAVIHSAAEADVIHPYVSELFPGPWAMYIGLHRSLSNNSVFQWVDGTVVDYQNWYTGEPNFENEACTEMYTEEMMWNDQKCEVERTYICSAKKVPPFLPEKNETALIESLQELNTNYLGETSLITTLTILLVSVLVVFAAGFTFYCYKNRCHKSNFQPWKYFPFSYSAADRDGLSELNQDENDK